MSKTAIPVKDAFPLRKCGVPVWLPMQYHAKVMEFIYHRPTCWLEMPSAKYLQVKFDCRTGDAMFYTSQVDGRVTQLCPTDEWCEFVGLNPVLPSVGERT